MTAPAYLARRPHHSRFIELRGLRHHLLEWRGEASNSSLPPLLMLHGWMDVGASFQFVVDSLREQGRTVISLDWRGFGQSVGSGSDAYWFPDYLGDLDALLDAISPLEPVDLLGHSMGGNIVMSYAGVRPARVRRLINLEGFGLPETKPEQAPGRLAKWLDDLKTPQELKTYPDLEAVAARLMKTNPRLSPTKAAWLAPHWSREQDGVWHILADAAHKRANPMLYRKDEIIATWASIEAPLLWVEGACTDLSKFWGSRYPRSDFESRISVVPKLQRQVLADAGHMLHHDQPEALAEAIESFLS
jgi:pimeloyl-ACP methyl ester carboxylesterase